MPQTNGPILTTSTMSITAIPDRPKSWVLESIIVMIVFMFPCGLVALIAAAKVNKNYDNGDYEKAIRMSRRAGRWNTIGLWIGIPLTIIHLFFWDQVIALF